MAFRTALRPLLRSSFPPLARPVPLTLSRRPLSSTSPRHDVPPRIEPKLRMTFTCTAPACTTPGVRSTHEFSRASYDRGIVLVQCPGCKTRHLIADHLGWFKDGDLTQGGKLRNVEDLLRAKGESVKRGHYFAEDGKDEGETITVGDEEPAQIEAEAKA